ncbi:hypothetical protein [Variovorax paradoxus]|uniref:hypothetical protein n=1 Tax=Variovorax paradoxus TaxID=34073 RepID=UPI004038D360
MFARALVDPRAATHRVEQRARAAALAHFEGLARIAGIAVDRHAALEHRLQVREQAHLEFFAAELRAHLVDAAERARHGFGRGLLLAQREFAACHAVPGPEAVVLGVGAHLPRRERAVQVARLRRLVLGQQQPRAGAVELRRERCVLGRRHAAEHVARPGRVTRLDQRVDQRGLHQRGITRRAVGQRLVIADHGAGVVAAAGAHVADHLLHRADHELRVARRMLERLACEFLGLLELARIAVDDGQVAVGHGHQVRIARGIGQVQRLAGGTHALAEFAGLGQGHRLAAVLVAGELDRVLPVKHRALAGQCQQGVGVGQPGLLGLAGRGFGVGRLLLRRRHWRVAQQKHASQPESTRDPCTTCRALPSRSRKPRHWTPARGPCARGCGGRRRGSARRSGLVGKV